MKQIIVTVSEDGQVEIRAVGFKGQSCTQATAALEKALGKVTKDTKTPEFYQDNKQHATH